MAAEYGRKFGAIVVTALVVGAGYVSALALRGQAPRSVASFADVMPADVSGTLRNRCYQCHGMNGVNSGGMGSVLDLKNLLDRRLIVPGQPSGSALLQKIVTGEMPVGGPRVPFGEQQAIRNWIAGMSTSSPTNPGGAAPGLPVVYGPQQLPTLAPTTAVLGHHANLRRDGHYVEPTLTLAAVQSVALLNSFSPGIRGDVYAQPLYVERAVNGSDALIVATEANMVYAVDPASGRVFWQRSLGTPVARRNLRCGNIDPLGITGTPTVDVASNSVFLDTMATPNNGTTKKHLVYRLSLRDGSVMSGWPVDVATELSRLGVSFVSEFQNQRGALALVGDMVYVPYGGHFGDCGDFRGMVVGISLSTPGLVRVFSTDAKEGGIWAPGGVSSNGRDLYVATGNTEGATVWGGGEALIRLPTDLTFHAEPASFFSPTNWQELDRGDVDVGGVAPVLLDVPTGPSQQLAIGFGKDGKIYVVNRNRPGGIGGALLVAPVASSVITAPAAYLTATGAYVAVKAFGRNCPGGIIGDLTVLRLQTSPSLAVSVAWCANQNGTGSPIVTTTDGHSNAVVWGLGAEDSGSLRAFDGQTGRVLLSGTNLPQMNGIARFQSPIVAKGKLFVVGGSSVYVYGPSGRFR